MTWFEREGRWLLAIDAALVVITTLLTIAFMETVSEVCVYGFIIPAFIILVDAYALLKLKKLADFQYSGRMIILTNKEPFDFKSARKDLAHLKGLNLSESIDREDRV